MKANRLYFILSLVIVVFFSSCMGRSNAHEIGRETHNPSFLTLVFSDSKASENLAAAKFRLEYDAELKDSIIVNNDSLPYQSRIDSVTARFVFMSSSKVILSIDGKERVIPHNTNVDKIDFSKPVKVSNTSGNKKNSRSYAVKVNVHTVDPDVYKWDRVSKGISLSAGKNQKALLFKEKFLFFSSDEAHAVSLFESADARQWSAKEISFIPILTKKPLLKTLTEHDRKLYLVDADARLYKSDDATVWNEVLVSGLKIKNLLFSFKDKIWAIASFDNVDYFASSTDGKSWEKAGEIPSDFPLVDYSSLVFKTAVGNPRVILLGHREAAEVSIDTRWATIDPANNKWVKYPVEVQDTLARVENAAIVQYDNRLVLFGGKNIKGESIGILESYNAGWTWKMPKKEQISLPKELDERLLSSAFLSADNKHIYFIGGVNKEKTLSDVWSVHLNKITFKGYKPGFFYH